MKILLTGATGYVGSALLPKLRAAGHHVIGIDLMWFREDETCIQRDVRSIEDIGDVDCVIHLAAISNDPTSSSWPRLSWETGTLATMRLAASAAAKGARFIYASSVSVYGADRGLVTEGMDLQPLSDYNKHKMVAERVLYSYVAEGLAVQIVRPATICGLSPRMRLDLTVNLLTVQALTKGVMTVHGGAQWRPSIHIDDMTDLYLWLLDHPEHHGVWNAGFENHTLIDIAQLIKREIGATIEVTPQVDRRSYQVNSDKLLSAGFKPRKSIGHAIAELADAWSANRLQDRPAWHNLGWMTTMGVEDK